MAQEKEDELLSHREKVETLLPHFLVAGAFVIFLFLNFLYYRRNNVQKYQRKIEKRAQELMSITPRRITSMMRYSEYLQPAYEAQPASTRGSKTELNGSGRVSYKMAAEMGVDEDGLAGTHVSMMDHEERDCASVRHTSLPVSPNNADNDYKPRPRYSLPPLVFASPGRKKHKQRRELDIL